MNDSIAVTRLLDKIEPEPMSECWIWVGVTRPNGYGQVTATTTKRDKLAHRRSWELFRGTIPKGMFVCHRCDVKSCVNPYHLFIGTPSDNRVDCQRKGRHPKKYKSAF